jgi:hypothetical protein
MADRLVLEALQFANVHCSDFKKGIQVSEEGDEEKKLFMSRTLEAPSPLDHHTLLKTSLSWREGVSSNKLPLSSSSSSSSALISPSSTTLLSSQMRSQSAPVSPRLLLNHDDEIDQRHLSSSTSSCNVSDSKLDSPSDMIKRRNSTNSYVNNDKWLVDQTLATATINENIFNQQEELGNSTTQHYSSSDNNHAAAVLFTPKTRARSESNNSLDYNRMNDGGGAGNGENKSSVLLRQGNWREIDIVGKEIFNKEYDKEVRKRDYFHLTCCCMCIFIFIHMYAYMFLCVSVYALFNHALLHHHNHLYLYVYISI